MLGNKYDTLKHLDSSRENDESVSDTELNNIVKSYKEEYYKKYNFDTTIKVGDDLFEIVFNYECLFDSGLIIPRQYVSIYGIKEFVTHNFGSSINVYKNRKLLTSAKISKSSFQKLLDSSLIKFGNLLYPVVKISSPPFLIDAKYSVSIPLTDVGKSVDFFVDKEGKVQIE